MNVSWYAVFAALFAVIALALALLDNHFDAITFAVIGVILALLSHRDA